MEQLREQLAEEEEKKDMIEEEVKEEKTLAEEMGWTREQIEANQRRLTGPLVHPKQPLDGRVILSTGNLDRFEMPEVFKKILRKGQSKGKEKREVFREQVSRDNLLVNES